MKNKEPVEWLQELMVPIQIPTRDDKILIQIYDSDPITNELICSITLSVKSLLKYDKSNPDPSQ